uniref:Subtilisin-like protease n=1 Tax=Daucus carota subsp. sativus TaxID=79200 RepID=A0A161Y1Z8_DAUCS
MSCGVLLALVTIFLQSSISITGADASEQTYIVHMKHYQKPDHVETHHAWYSSNLQSLSSSATLLYTYTTTYHGFSASLSLQEAQQLRQYDSVIDIQEENSSNLCLAGSLDPDLVRGKVVVCDRAVNKRVEKGEAVKNAGGVGMILANTAENCEDLQTDSHVIPTVAVGQKMGDVIREYLRKVKNPTATLVFGGTVLGVRPSPLVAPFSSRGPNVVTPQILKPDVIGPGVSILAASSEAVGPSVLDSDTRRTKYRIMSGTSMSCPHISGVAALLKAGHPDWSTSAIKSALMTTAYTRDNTESPFRNAETGNKSNPWAYGSGYVDPYKAMSPGLVYDSSPEDYIAFLCSLDYSIAQIQSIAKHSNITCSKRLSDPGQLNYPSFSVIFGKSRVVHYTRELTNVGAAGSAYEVVVDAPSVIDMTVNPSKLVFKNVGDKHQYTITFRTKKVIIEAGKSAFGSISWNNAKHQVSSPVAFSWTRD